MSVSFRYTDAAILFCVPENGCDLNYLVQRYTCFERVAVPSYEVVAGCLDRAVRAGIMGLPVGVLYHLTAEGYVRVHQRDAEFSPSEVAMIEFAEELVGCEWPEVGTTKFVLPVDEYKRAADHTREYLAQLFALYRK